MSKKKADTKERVATPKSTSRQISTEEFGLSFPVKGRGFKLMPEGYVMCEEIFTLLFERFDEEMMKKRVEGEYK